MVNDLPTVSAKRKALHKRIWMKKFEALQAWMYDNGHRFPSMSEDKVLNSWVHCQRRSERSRLLDDEQRSLLKSIGYSFKAQAVNFDGALARFKAKPNGRPSRAWRYRMRLQYQKGTLTEEQQKKLIKLFDLTSPIVNDLKLRSDQMAVSRQVRHDASVQELLPIYMATMDEERRPFLTYAQRERVSTFKYGMKKLYKKGSLTEKEIKLFREIKLL